MAPLRCRPDLHRGPTKAMAQFKDRLPSNYSLLLSGPPGVGKFEYMLDLMGDFLQDGDKVIFVAVDVHPQEVRDRALTRGLRPAEYEGKDLLFVDCYSPSILENGGGSADRSVASVSSFSDLEGLGLAIARAARQLKTPVKILFYTLSTLFLHNPPSTLSKFLQILSARVKTELGLVVYAVHAGVHDERTTALLASLVDGVLEMRYADGMRREIRIHHLRGIATNPIWVAFDIEPPRHLLGEPLEENPP